MNAFLTTQMRRLAKRSDSARKSSPGLRIRRILVPVDFSPGSGAALEHARRIGRTFGSRITAFHVVEMDPGWLQLGSRDYPLLDHELRENQCRRLLAFAGSGPHGPSACVVRIGRAAEEIVRFADETSTDLIVISTRGLNGLRRAFIGSIAEKVTRHAHCPVWIVPLRK
jgi:nucleotide-binding universal stress UspA family protein